MNTSHPNSNDMEGGASPLFIVVRLKGSPNMQHDVKRTLCHLRLLRTFSACLLRSNPTYVGMLKSAKDVLSWGEIDRAHLGELLAKRGRLVGNKRLTEENIKNLLHFENLDTMAQAIFDGRIQIKDINHLKPFFRLSPPKGGLKVSKRVHKFKAHKTRLFVLGYINGAINELVSRMI